MDIEKTIREYLPGVIHMSLATSAGNKPWICEVHYAFDADLNLYFRSKRHRRHSIEIAVNQVVAGNIVAQHTIGEEVRGVYFEGRAELLTNVTETNPAYQAYCERFATGPDILEESHTENGHAFYKISVSTFYLFDSQESNPSHKYELPWQE